MKELSLALLKFQMNYPMDDELQIVGSIQDMQVEPDVEKLAEGWDYKSRPDYQVLEANRKLQALNLRNQHAGALPTISAFGRYGYQTQSNNIGGLFKTNTQLEDAGGIGPDKWYNYSVYGVSLNWNIFTGTQRHHKIQQEKLALQKIENSFRSLKSGIDLEVKQSSITFENALKTLTSQKQNMELAGNVARVTRIKFEQGVGSSLEVVTAESALKEAQNNYYNALYDAMIAKVDLDKAYGLLTPPAASTETK
jgi:outer membrane protein TolC